MDQFVIHRIIMCGLFSIILMPAPITSSRILLVPSMFKSHVNFFAVTARKLQDSGHEVALLTLDRSVDIVRSFNVKAFTLPEPDDMRLFTSETAFTSFVLKISHPVQLFGNFTMECSAYCTSIHEYSQLIETLKELKFDIALVDGVDYARCLYSVLYRLHLKYITVSARPDPWNAGVSALPSVEGVLGAGLVMSADSTFADRVKSLAMSILVWYSMPPSVLDDNMITKYVPDRPKTTFSELFKMSEMWFVDRDMICMHQPVVYGYHYQYMAGLASSMPKPLPVEIEEFVSASDEGLAVFSFGSEFSNIPKNILNKMLIAFGHVKYRIIMRHKGDIPNNTPSNVIILPWIPQNDLLGHPKSRVFITHGGANGLGEALHHKVPVIIFPLFGDQPYNAEEAARKGFGVILDKDRFTSQELVEALNDVAGTDKFRINIGECSERLSALKSAQPDISFWVEHVIRYGSDHLKPAALYVPLWKMFMLDILAAAMIVTLFLYTLFLIAIKYLWRKCHLTRASTSKKKN